MKLLISFRSILRLVGPIGFRYQSQYWYHYMSRTKIGLGIDTIQCPEPRPVSVSVPFKIEVLLDSGLCNEGNLTFPKKTLVFHPKIYSLEWFSRKF